MDNSKETLSVELHNISEKGKPYSDISVSPPLSEEDILDIKLFQVPKYPILGELLTLQTSSSDAEFRIPGYENDHILLMAEDLARAVLAIRGMHYAYVKHQNGEFLVGY